MAGVKFDEAAFKARYPILSFPIIRAMPLDDRLMSERDPRLRAAMNLAYAAKEMGMASQLSDHLSAACLDNSSTSIWAMGTALELQRRSISRLLREVRKFNEMDAELLQFTEHSAIRRRASAIDNLRRGLDPAWSIARETELRALLVEAVYAWMAERGDEYVHRLNTATSFASKP
jgi:hypothetical protein